MYIMCMCFTEHISAPMVLTAPHFATVIQMQVIVTKDITLECKVGIMFVDMLYLFFCRHE